MIFDGLGAGLNFDARQTGEQNVTDGTGLGGYFSGLSFRRPVAGVPVDRDSAMTYGAYYACVRLISENIAMLPWRAYEAKNGRRNIAEGHPTDAMLYRAANDETNSFEFRVALMVSAITQGNGIAEIERLRTGEAAAQWHIDWDRVNPDRDSQGRLIYDISETNGPNTVLKASDVIHLRGGPTYDGVSGLSVLQYAKQSISLGLAMEQFGAGFFGNGAMPSGVIETENEWSAPDGWSSDAAKNLKRGWQKRNSNAGGKNGGVEILEPGQKFKAISVSPGEAQFLESRQNGVIDICRWMNVKPHKVMSLERSTNNNIESQNIEHVTDCLLPWATRMEQEYNFKVFRTQTNRYTKLNLSALLRGDLKAREAFYKSMLDRGVYNIDEVRAFEEMNPLEDGLGEQRFIPMNMASLEYAKTNGNTGLSKDTTKGTSE